MTIGDRYGRIDTEPSTLKINAQNRDHVQMFIQAYNKEERGKVMENRETVTAFKIAQNFASKHQDELDEIKKMVMQYQDPIRGKMLFLMAYIEELEEKIAVVELGDE